jgi:hypothetical protein
MDLRSRDFNRGGHLHPEAPEITSNPAVSVYHRWLETRGFKKTKAVIAYLHQYRKERNVAYEHRKK